MKITKTVFESQNIHLWQLEKGGLLLEQTFIKGTLVSFHHEIHVL